MEKYWDTSEMRTHCICTDFHLKNVVEWGGYRIGPDLNLVARIRAKKTDPGLVSVEVSGNMSIDFSAHQIRPWEQLEN